MPYFISLLHTQPLPLVRRISGRKSVLCDCHDITILLTMAISIQIPIFKIINNKYKLIETVFSLKR